MAKLFNPFFQAIDGNGKPISGAKLYFYQTGTTTPLDTFSQSDCAPGHENTNPVVADSTGRFGPIYMPTTTDYKAILKDSAGTTLSNGTLDPLLNIITSVIAHQGSIIIGNSSGADSELTISATNGARLTSTGTTAEWRAPAYTKQAFLSGSGTYTTPANCTAIKIRVQAGGGGGGGCGGTTGPDGAAGGNSSFNSIVATGGGAGKGNATGSSVTTSGAGGTGGTGTASLRIPGGAGGWGGNSGVFRPGSGGSYSGPGVPLTIATGAAAGLAAPTNSGAGGGGASASGTVEAATAGGGGEYFELHISTPSANYAYAVGGGGAGGVGTGTGAATGGAGAAGYVIVEEFYS